VLFLHLIWGKILCCFYTWCEVRYCVVFTPDVRSDIVLFLHLMWGKIWCCFYTWCEVRYCVDFMVLLIAFLLIAFNMLMLTKFALLISIMLFWVSEWLLFNANSAIFSAISWPEQINIQWDDEEVRFVLDQLAETTVHG